MSCHSAVDGLHSVREVKSALSQHSATKRCKCTSWMTLLLRDVDLDQFDHMAAEPTHGPHHSCSSSSWLGASDPFLAIGNLFPYGGSIFNQKPKGAPIRNTVRKATGFEFRREILQREIEWAALYTICAPGATRAVPSPHVHVLDTSLCDDSHD